MKGIGNLASDEEVAGETREEEDVMEQARLGHYTPACSKSFLHVSPGRTLHRYRS